MAWNDLTRDVRYTFRSLGQMVDRSVSPRRFVLALLGAFALTALLLASLGIYGVSPTDPTTFLIMMLVLILVSGFAGFLPARRASRIDPMSVLRSAQGTVISGGLRIRA